MSKKLLMMLGIVLLLAVSFVGLNTFVDRHRNKELIPATPAAQISTNNTQEPAKESFNKKKYSISDPTSSWVIVNKKQPLVPLEYAPADLVTVRNNQRMRQEAATALAALIGGAKDAGLTIQADSGYRSYSTQVTVYGNEVKNYGQAVADTESAKPGHSEHQTGWAVDVGSAGCHIDDCFGGTPEGKWVVLHAYEYGFIIRYPSDKQAITGYRYEPWHIRYIGTELSTEMHKQNVTTLEEFFKL